MDSVTFLFANFNHNVFFQVDIHVRFAAFEEEQGRREAALNVLKKIEKQHPELISLPLKRVNLERRLGNVEEVHNLYR